VTSLRVLPLDEVRADGWLEGLRKSSPDIERLIDVTGELTFAFATILGVRIASIRVDAAQPDASVVEIVLGADPETTRLSLGDLRRRVIATLAELPMPSEPVPVEGTRAELEAFVGGALLLLAPLFGVSVLALLLDGDEAPRLRVAVGRARDDIPLAELYAVLRERVAAEAKVVAQPPPFSIDLGTIPKADDAVRRGDHDEVVRLLQPWAGPLSGLLRTSEGQSLSADVKASLAHALGMLGTAQAAVGQASSAEDVLRLGIQWAQGGTSAARLFRRLGQHLAAVGRGPEAIGLLRRASALGEPPRLVLPTLATCFADAGKMVAAAACLDEALAVGCDEAELAATRARVADALGAHWERFRAACPRPSQRRATIPPKL
jgi:hypothetical protein